MLHAALLVATLGTTTVAGSLWTPGGGSAEPAILRGMLYAVPLLGILLAHEAGHHAMCRRHGLGASLPYFLPGPPIPMFFGTFGAFIRIHDRFQNRRVLFDVGAGGPWAGFFVALPVMIVGLYLSTVDLEGTMGRRIAVGDSLLTNALSHLVLGTDTRLVHLHPVALAGWFGLFLTSVNLFPVGRLDGGHVLYAAGGQRRPVVPALVVGLMLWLGWQWWLGWLAWSIVLGTLVAMGHPSTERDEVPLGPGRRVGVAATTLLFLATFVAEPLRIIS